MDWEVIAPVIFGVVVTLTLGGVLLLRPIAKRLAAIVELMLLAKHEGADGELHRMGDLLEDVDARMRLLGGETGLLRAASGFVGPGEGGRGRACFWNVNTGRWRNASC